MVMFQIIKIFVFFLDLTIQVKSIIIPYIFAMHSTAQKNKYFSQLVERSLFFA